MNVQNLVVSACSWFRTDSCDTNRKVDVSDQLRRIRCMFGCIPTWSKSFCPRLRFYSLWEIPIAAGLTPGALPLINRLPNIFSTWWCRNHGTCVSSTSKDVQWEIFCLIGIVSVVTCTVITGSRHIPQNFMRLLLSLTVSRYFAWSAECCHAIALAGPIGKETLTEAARASPLEFVCKIHVLGMWDHYIAHETHVFTTCGHEAPHPADGFLIYELIAMSLCLSGGIIIIQSSISSVRKLCHTRFTGKVS